MKRYFMPLLAALALTACSSEQGAEPENPEVNDYGFVAVNIVQSNEDGTRAPGFDTFENGTSEENYAQNGLFFIFDNDGNISGTAQSVPLTAATGTTATPAVEKIYNAVLVVNGVKTKPATDLQIVCVLNAPARIESATTITELRTKLANYADGYTSNGKFIMTNSVYAKDADGNGIIGAQISDENIKTSASEALNKPVEIYVERVVSKLKVDVQTNFDNKGAKPVIDGTPTALDIVITGMEIANIAQKSYLFKNVSGINSSWSWVWDNDNKRSYWETVSLTASSSPVFNNSDGTYDTKGDYENQSYNQIVGSGNFNITNAKIEKMYIQPNTSDQKTSVLVTAELRKPGESVGLDFVFYKGYFTPDEALKLIATEIAGQGYMKRTSADGAAETHYETLAPSDFEWKNNVDLGKDQKIEDLRDYEVVAQVKAGTTNLVKKSGDNYTSTDVATINGVLKTMHARYYNKGKCYYYVEVDQTPVAVQNGFTQNTENPTKFLGVVRNHIYNLTLSSIVGLGTPVFDPSDIIIPQRPDDETLYYLAARVKVLKWKIVSQNVDFTGLGTGKDS